MKRIEMKISALPPKERQKIEFIIEELSNDEVSSDEELIDYFLAEIGLSREEATEWVKKRTYYLNNIIYLT